MILLIILLERWLIDVSNSSVGIVTGLSLGVKSNSVIECFWMTKALIFLEFKWEFVNSFKILLLRSTISSKFTIERSSVFFHRWSSMRGWCCWLLLLVLGVHALSEARKIWVRGLGKAFLKVRPGRRLTDAGLMSFFLAAEATTAQLRLLVSQQGNALEPIWAARHLAGIVGVSVQTQLECLKPVLENRGLIHVGLLRNGQNGQVHLVFYCAWNGAAHP